MSTRPGAKKIVLIFGEDDHDRRALKELALALRPKLPSLQPRRDPLVLVKNRDAARAKKNAQDIATQVARDRKIHDVRLVIAHQDADAVEPAHEPIAIEIERHLEGEGIPVVAAVPAWELEAWFYLWPAALEAVCGQWRLAKPPRRQVGLILNAKEALKRALRPSGARPGAYRAYTESDGPLIAAKVRALGIVDDLAGDSASFSRFRERLLGARL